MLFGISFGFAGHYSIYCEGGLGVIVPFKDNKH